MSVFSKEKQIIAEFIHYVFVPSLNKAADASHRYNKIITDDSIPFFEKDDHRAARHLLSQIVSDGLKK